MNVNLLVKAAPVSFSGCFHESGFLCIQGPCSIQWYFWPSWTQYYFRFWYFTCSQLCDEIDEHEKNSQDMIEEEKKKIPGTWKRAFTKSFILWVDNLLLTWHNVKCQNKIYQLICAEVLIMLKYEFLAFRKTSLVKPIGVFVQFLKGLEGENDNRRKRFRETEGKSTLEFFAILSRWKHITDIFSKRSKVSRFRPYSL